MNFLNILFPARCPVCGDVQELNATAGICKSCYRQLPFVTEPCCKHCGKPIADGQAEFCYDCKKKKSSLTEGTALYVYTERMKKAMAQFKYGGSQVDGDVYGKELWKHRGGKLLAWRLDCIIPVPLHRRRQWFRGYNQAELLAEKLSEAMNVPVLADCLERKRYTRPQKGLDDRTRLKNVKGAFGWKEDAAGESVRGRNVLLVDDIYTTGATLESCGDILRRQGAKNVYFACLCIGRDY